MQGIPTPGSLTDPEGKRTGWQKAVGDQKDRDLKFFDVVLKDLKSSYKVAPKQIYATGHSNGGGFTYVLWAARHDVFAAVAPSAASSGWSRAMLKPLPALHVAGENDPLVKFAMQTRSIDGIRITNGCDEKGQLWAKLDDLVGTIYPSKGGTPVVTLIFPGTHTFHKSAPKLIVKFFKEHAKK
jgi:polyhydroxybutyrate depolymerase